MDPREPILALCDALGFRHCRVVTVPAGGAPRIDELLRWINAGHAGEMRWIEDTLPIRRDPGLRLPGARSALVLGTDYHAFVPPDPGGLSGRVARYAWGRDYHNLVGKRLNKLRKRLNGMGIRAWGGVDRAPILERGWAEAGGLGWAGKNCMQILPARGSYFFLAVMFVDVALEPDPPVRDHCGRCVRCLVACPSQAFVGPHQLDARRCISYWTIEAEGAVPEELRSKLGRWVFGCDECQEVCPHNAAPPEVDELDLMPRNAWLDLPELLESTDAQLSARFLGTPLARPGPEGLRRNACVVLGNLGDAAAIPLLRRSADSGGPLVREHARWALGRLGG